MSGYYDETYEVYKEEPVTARKAHTCDACKETIPAKATYWKVFTLFDGNVDSLKRCNRCEAIHVHLRNLCAGTGDEIWPDERLACGLKYEDEWGELPDHIAALAFALPSEPYEVPRD